ncbi:ABC transporter thiamine pyrophosphate-binding lipoprotein p37/Cypl [Mycoplasmopsis gallinarum]|uniref:Putative lipoprotein (ABC transporter, substrate binding) n=1 Tax=Mycoplasmopsis gallinarum TaxID=29557 RepID=A0A168RBE0_9BACT|nr:hypothetical protein [Mycoplasmopsis gallinarum]OAB48805.1 putative lipoprotein (ABC transporter, substrate binding) [Mycoplasmopsis gallinarum]
MKKLAFLPLTLLSPLALVSAGCQNTEKADDSLKNWDKNLVINNDWINPGFKGTEVETQFLKLVTNKFNEIKNKDPKLASLPDVTITINGEYSESQLLQDLKSNKLDADFGILPYHSFAEEIKNEAELAEFNLPLTVQTSTLRFIWTPKENNQDAYIAHTDEAYYDLLAQNENEQQFKAYGEFPDWTDADPRLKFDGSKYAVFYADDTIDFYSGSILISGNKTTRDQIKAAWDSRNWDQFVAFGITFKETSSGGAYKYQINRLAKHFNKPLTEVHQYFIQDNNPNVLKGNDVSGTLGKSQENEKVYHIAFDDNGSFNWTAKSWGDTLFKPSNFVANQAYDSETNDVVRVMTTTEWAPYDVMFARRGMNAKQNEIMQQVLASLTKEQNTYGIFTGFNLFKATTLQEFKKYLAQQHKAEGREHSLVLN